MPPSIENQSFQSWSQNVSKEGHPPEEESKPKSQPWKEFRNAKKRTEPAKGKALVIRAYDEDMSESHLGQ